VCAAGVAGGAEYRSDAGSSAPCPATGGVSPFSASRLVNANAFRATAADVVSSTVERLWLIATGKIAAIMMKPIPSTITANMTSVKEKAEG
jgi:hypothetical protein